MPGRATLPATERPRPPTSTPYPTSTSPAPAASPTPSIALNESGPWLTYLVASKSGAEMAAANPDGSGRAVIGAFASLGAAIITRPRLAVPADGAGTRWFSLQNTRDVSLTVFELPTGRALASFPLISNPDLTADQRAIYTHILNQTDPPAHAWSPDGTRLAFISAIDGPSTDLYVYSAASGQTLRLTEGNSEASFPVWSPDGQWILLQEVETFQTAGYSLVRVVYAFKADGSDYRALYRPASRGEEIFGWTDEDTFVVASLRANGLVEARRFSLEKGMHAQLQFAGLMGQAALDPDGAALGFIVPAVSQELNALPAGVYWTTAQTGPISVLRGKWTRVEWSAEAGRFFAAGPEGVLSFYPNTDKALFADEETLPVVSPDGKRLVFAGGANSRAPGLRLYAADGALQAVLLDDPVSEALWLPGGEAVYAVSGGALLRVEIPSGRVGQMAKGVSQLGWVGQ